MKAVNVDVVLKILHKYGKYIFVTDEKKYSDMVDEISNLKALEQEPCDDCIRRSDIGLTDFEIVMCNGDYKEALKMILDKIEKAPSVTPQQKIGRWIEHIHNGMHYIECPKCSSWFLRMYLTRNSYCPNCGARMQEVKE